MATILEQLKKIIIEQLGVDDELVTLEASFAEDLNADAADLAELVAAIEKAFSTPKRRVTIADEAVEEVVTVQDMLDLLRDSIPED